VIYDISSEKIAHSLDYLPFENGELCTKAVFSKSMMYLSTTCGNILEINLADFSVRTIWL
jgi:hypothetical protein